MVWTHQSARLEGGENADDGATHRTRLAAEAARLRAAGGLGRSDMLDRLFDYLLERSLEGRLPKEFEVAQEVFGKGAEFDMVQDASVRVSIHRLRRKLEEYYAGQPAEADRLVVPRGEYRLALDHGAVEAPVAGEPLPAAVPTAIGRPRRFWLAAALICGINVAGWAAYIATRPGAPYTGAVASKFWNAIAQSPARTLIVAGDYYIFGETPDSMEVTRLVREFSINSREDLDNFTMSHPESDGRYVDVDLHYLPTSTATALRDILPVANFAAAKVTRPRVLSMSGLSPEMLKTANVVYVGFFSGLGLLRNPLFEASGFKVGSSYDDLIDRASGRHFSSDWGVVTDGKTPRRDFGYLASIPGPTGNHILIIAGTRDAAVMQAAEVAADRQQLARIDAIAGQTGAFEALYEVRTLGNLNLGSRLVLARPLRAAGIWQPDRGEQAFPDQSGSGGGPRP